ncbi:hypothetical protein GBA65_15215 [Rubrobacter marinus]|uniref:Uncharacterized protein n=1 Tax=Rubrobacter marinus TaxID=2653852 RepID=A0A6G8PZK6_9ACTN|nr:hypothetical protein [Rubrobacter marinus]QIN79653.1 hypothetical protein GBA65_15215 [Rubrobacter marinus]
MILLLGKGSVEIRILVAFEDEYRAFRDTIAEALRVLRPGDEVEAAGLGAIGNRVARFDPHLVIASVPNAFDPGGRVAWVELSPDPEMPSEVCVGGRRREAANPSVEDLVFVAEETEGLIGEERNPRAC